MGRAGRKPAIQGEDYPERESGDRPEQALVPTERSAGRECASDLARRSQLGDVLLGARAFVQQRLGYRVWQKLNGSNREVLGSAGCLGLAEDLEIIQEK